MRNIDEISGLVLRANGAYVIGAAPERSERRACSARRLRSTPAKLAAYAGDYGSTPNVLLRVSTSGDGLDAQLTRCGTQRHARCTRPDRFADADGAERIEFRARRARPHQRS